jgi:hypothetical protein
VAAYQTDKDRHPTCVPICQCAVVGFGGKPPDPMGMSSLVDGERGCAAAGILVPGRWEGTVVAALDFRGGYSVAA